MKISLIGLVLTFLVAFVLPSSDSPTAPSLTSYEVVVSKNEAPVVAVAPSNPTTTWLDIIWKMIPQVPTMSFIPSSWNKVFFYGKAVQDKAVNNNEIIPSISTVPPFGMDLADGLNNNGPYYSSSSSTSEEPRVIVVEQWYYNATLNFLKGYLKGKVINFQKRRRKHRKIPKSTRRVIKHRMYNGGATCTDLVVYNGLQKITKKKRQQQKGNYHVSVRLPKLLQVLSSHETNTIMTSENKIQDALLTLLSIPIVMFLIAMKKSQEQVAEGSRALVVYDKLAYAMVVYDDNKTQSFFKTTTTPPTKTTTPSVPDFSSGIPTFGARRNDAEPSRPTFTFGGSAAPTFGGGSSSTSTFTFGGSSSSSNGENEPNAANTTHRRRPTRRRPIFGGSGSTTMNGGTKKRNRDPRYNTIEYQIANNACQPFLILPNEGTTSSQVESLYRRISLKYHPDKNTGSDPKLASAVFREIKLIKDEKLAKLR